MATFNSYYDYGMCQELVRGLGTISVTNGSSSATLSNATDYAAIQNGDMIFPEVSGPSSYGYWPAFGVLSGGGTANITLERPYVGTSTSYPIYYNLYPRVIGAITKWTRSLECPVDVIGMPGQRWLGTLAFDFEGNVMKWVVTGFIEDTPANCGAWKHNIDVFFDSNRGVALAGMIWGECEYYAGAPRAYPMILTKFDVDYDVGKIRSGSSNMRVDFKLEAIGRSPTGY
jgi:hypothetical protein